MVINAQLVHQLISAQFPRWSNLSIKPVHVSGWDNCIFHLGAHMLVRMPSAAPYALQVTKEQLWLPKLAPLLPLQIPNPLALGEPTVSFPWHWSIYEWIEGETAASVPAIDLCRFAHTLAHFLLAFHSISAANGPLAGPQNFYRGSPLNVYDDETRQAIDALKDNPNAKLFSKVWEAGCTSSWQKIPVWVHGDISAGNLLVKNDQLSAVIDFGQLGVGDPACDLVIAWTFLDEKSRGVFRDVLCLDEATWARGRAWALWKALIVVLDPSKTNIVEAQQAWRTLLEIIAEWTAKE